MKCLHHPRCNLAPEWHHWRQFIRSHPVSSRAPEASIVLSKNCTQNWTECKTDIHSQLLLFNVYCGVLISTYSQIQIAQFWPVNQICYIMPFSTILKRHNVGRKPVRNDVTCATDARNLLRGAAFLTGLFACATMLPERACKDGCTGSSVLGCSDTLIPLMYVQNISLVRRADIKTG